MEGEEKKTKGVIAMATVMEGGGKRGEGEKGLGWVGLGWLRGRRRGVEVPIAWRAKKQITSSHFPTTWPGLGSD